jgi:hypothetical protein
MRQSSAPSVTKTVDNPFPFFCKSKLFVTARKPDALAVRRRPQCAVSINRKENLMSDTIDFMASYKNHQKALAEANAINKANSSMRSQRPV